MASEYNQPATEAAFANFYVQIAEVGADSSLTAAEKSVKIADITNALQVSLQGEQVGEREVAEPATTTDPGSVMVFKDTTGGWRWVAVHTNKYVDRTKEIFPETAHKEYVDHVWATKEFPALRLWHIPVDIGRADFVDYDTNGFVVSSGHFKAGMEDVAQRLAGMKGLGCSHGYLYRRGDLQNGVYKSYRSYEVSVLPVDRAANTLTAFFADSEVPMLTEARKAFLVDVMGPERADNIEHGIEELARIAGERGLSYKSLEEALLDNVRAAAGDANPMEQCPECDKMVPKGDMAAHMQDAHNGVAAKKDDEPVTTAEPVVETPPDAEPAEIEMARVQAAEAAAAAAVVDLTPPADAPTPTDEERADAAALLAAVGTGSAEADGDGQKDIGSVLRQLFSETVAPLQDEMRGLRSLVETQAAEIVALQGERSAAIADMIRPRVGVDTRAVAAASASDDNLVDPEAMRKVKEAVDKKAATGPVGGYLDDMFQLMGAASGAASLGAPR